MKSTEPTIKYYNWNALYKKADCGKKHFNSEIIKRKGSTRKELIKFKCLTCDRIFFISYRIGQKRNIKSGGW